MLKNKYVLTYIYIKNTAFKKPCEDRHTKKAFT